MVRIVTDTTSGLPRDQAAALGIAIVPQIVVFGKSSYRDDNEIDTEDFEFAAVFAGLAKDRGPAARAVHPYF